MNLKLFSFSLRDRAKIWFSSLSRNSIDSSDKRKDAFIAKYFSPVKIISHRTQIMNFKQLEHQHVAQSWESNAAFLNLVTKDQFSGLPSEDAESHLNNFIDLCDMRSEEHTSELQSQN